MMDLEVFKGIIPKQTWTMDDIAKDSDDYESCVKALNSAGRYNALGVVKEHGSARVVQVFAAVIKRNPADYDTRVVAWARQVPDPHRSPSGFVDWHRAFIQAEFIRLVRPHLIQKGTSGVKTI